MTDTRPRTAAANEAWREKGAISKAKAFVERVEWLDDQSLLNLTERLVWECQRRGLAVPIDDEGPAASHEG